jgi:hypothetical protein
LIIRADDITVEGIDLIVLDPSSGKIVDFKVMVRPLKTALSPHLNLNQPIYFRG